MTPSADDEQRRGATYALTAYALWGLFPLYFHALEPAGAFEILAHRILWTLAVCVLVLLLRRDLGWTRRIGVRRWLGLTTAALLIAVNWVVYVQAVLTDRTHEAALGYFLNPLVTVALGIVILRERLRPLQWAAVAVGAVAGLYLTVAGGSFPWIAITLACSFGLYGLVKKRVGATLPAMHSLSVETAVLAPIAAVMLIVLADRGETTFTTDGALHTGLLVASGIVTAVPLLLFAASARRIPLVLVGMIQFITPVLQLLAGVLVLGEHVPGDRWIGFGIVWIALLLLTIDSVRAGRTSRRARLAARTAELEESAACAR